MYKSGGDRQKSDSILPRYRHRHGFPSNTLLPSKHPPSESSLHSGPPTLHFSHFVYPLSRTLSPDPVPPPPPRSLSSTNSASLTVTLLTIESLGRPLPSDDGPRNWPTGSRDAVSSPPAPPTPAPPIPARPRPRFPPRLPSSPSADLPFPLPLPLPFPSLGISVAPLESAGVDAEDDLTLASGAGEAIIQLFLTPPAIMSAVWFVIFFRTSSLIFLAVTPGPISFSFRLFLGLPSVPSSPAPVPPPAPSPSPMAARFWRSLRASRRRRSSSRSTRSTANNCFLMSE
ncbi:hypothetical protein BC936DRAFT_142672 [Jimgerdemannia flammicorona]|uniref:Uncharacterized protein n=1 Tax=Jimgerdemannia flammicorona TaxID=994334 RepID=A0A433DEY8_9FUNG|nr:hypothetical protein BC936DRAFT_142672 [Jimgerdemannia flammicorona]